MCCDLAIRQTLPIASAIAIALRTFCAFEQLKYLSSTRRQLTLPTGEFRVSKCNANVQLAVESGALLLPRLHLKWAEQTDVAHGARRRKGRRSRSCRKTFHSTERERRARERRERRRGSGVWPAWTGYARWGLCNMRSTWRNFCQVEIKGAAVAAWSRAASSFCPKLLHKKPLKAHVVKVKRQIRIASEKLYTITIAK